jgi:hypothetical protein
VRCRGRVRDTVGSHDIVDGLTISCRHYNGTRVRNRAALRYPIASVRDIVRGAISFTAHEIATPRRYRTNQRLVMGWRSGVVVIVDATRHPGGGIGLLLSPLRVPGVWLVYGSRGGPCLVGVARPLHQRASAVKHAIRYYPRHVSGNCNKYPDIKHLLNAECTLGRDRIFHGVLARTPNAPRTS